MGTRFLCPCFFRRWLRAHGWCWRFWTG